MSTVLDKAANVAMICASVAVCVVAVTYVRTASNASRTAQIRPYEPGDIAEGIPAKAFERSPRTLMMFVNSSCRFCTESMGFYQQVIDRAARSRGDVRVVAVSSEDVSITREYLSTYHIVADDVFKLDVRRTRFQGTPTLMLVTKLGRVTNIWTGLLPTETQHNDVLASINNP